MGDQTGYQDSELPRSRRLAVAVPAVTLRNSA
jgi:hypothetical protein